MPNQKNTGESEQFNPARDALRKAVDQFVRQSIDDFRERIQTEVRYAVGQALTGYTQAAQNATALGFVTPEKGRVVPEKSPSPVVKRGPGRPRKNPLFDAAPVEPIKRGPGRPPKATTEFKAPSCNVRGCRKPHRAKGYCASHYNKALAAGWPRPAPRNFTPPQIAEHTPAQAATSAPEPETKSRTFEVNV